jgi:leucyl/phenylalanyl-tRNA--protein transferase
MPVYRLTEDLSFPPVHLAEDGLLAVGGDLDTKRLLLAYRSGIFPWYCAGEPMLWWSPDPRMILVPDDFHMSRSLERVLKQGTYRVTLDEAFEEVIRCCAAVPRRDQDGTWITEEMIAAYSVLHEEGYAHSVECWLEDRLVGGLYGISLGACFFGESMFSHEANASKVALATAVAQFKRWKIGMIDCQVENPHLFSLGAREIPRGLFMKLLAEGLQVPTRKGRWRLDVE